MKVTIYSTSTCATCHLVTRFLDKKAVKYTKINTDEDPKAMEEFMNINEGNVGVPFTVIEKDGKTEKIPGFDSGKFVEALDL